MNKENISELNKETKSLKKRLVRRKSSKSIVTPNDSKHSSPKKKSKEEFRVKFPDRSTNEKVVELIIALIVLPFIFLDYGFSGFNSGNPLFISDSWDMVITCLYLRQTLFEGFGWTMKDFSIDINTVLNSIGLIDSETKPTKDRKQLTMQISRIFYVFLSSYFFYCISGRATLTLLLGDPSQLFKFWFDFQFMFQFFVLGILPTYFMPGDYLYKMVYENNNKVHELIGDSAWSVSKLDSLKRTVLVFKRSVGFSAFTQSLVLFPALVFSCQLAATLKPLEVNYAQNKGKLDSKRAKKEFVEMLKGTGMKASVVCAFSLSVRFLLSSTGSSFLLVLLFDLMALGGLFYRYSSDILFTFGKEDLYHYDEAGRVVRRMVMSRVKVD